MITTYAAYSPVTTTHRLVSPNGVQEGGIVPGANFRQDEGQKAAVAIQLGVHEVLKIKQVCNDVHRYKKAKKEIYFDKVSLNSQNIQISVKRHICKAVKCCVQL